jgi:hypothetical protein
MQSLILSDVSKKEFMAHSCEFIVGLDDSSGRLSSLWLSVPDDF